jgi:hypothetical protein
MFSARRGSRSAPHPTGEIHQNRFLFYRFNRTPSNLSNMHDRLRGRHAFRYPVSCCERSGSAGSAFTVNDRLCSGGQSVNKFHELLKLCQYWRTEVRHEEYCAARSPKRWHGQYRTAALAPSRKA